MENLINDPNPWILNIGSGVIAAVISRLVIQYLAQRRTKKPEKLHTSGQVDYQATVKEPFEENKRTSKVWGTMGSCLGMVALTIGYVVLIAGLRWIENSLGDTGIALICCIPSLLIFVVLFVITAREEGLI